MKAVRPVRLVRVRAKAVRLVRVRVRVRVRVQPLVVAAEVGTVRYVVARVLEP